MRRSVKPQEGPRPPGAGLLGSSVTRILKFDNPAGERVAVNQHTARGTRKRNGTGRKVVVRNDVPRGALLRYSPSSE